MVWGGVGWTSIPKVVEKWPKTGEKLPKIKSFQKKNVASQSWLKFGNAKLNLALPNLEGLNLA